MKWIQRRFAALHFRRAGFRLGLVVSLCQGALDARAVEFEGTTAAQRP